MSTYLKLLAADGNWYSFIRALEGEPLSAGYVNLQKYTNTPNWLRPVLTWYLKQSKEYRKSILFNSSKSGGYDVREYWEIIADMKEIQMDYMNYFHKEHLDGLILPTLPMTAPKHGYGLELLVCLSYTFLGNLLHWPAGVVPITTVQPNENVYNISELSSYQQDSFAKLIEQMTIDSIGLPVGIQIMTPMWKDEECLYIMSIIEQLCQFNEKPNV